MSPDQYCQQLLQQSGSSFALSFVFLEEPRRQAMTALYAFCRQVDDIVDHCQEPAVAETSLNWWRNEVERLYQGNPSHPIALALATALQRYPLSRAYFQDIIDGMAQDLHQNRYQTRAELEMYSYRVAGAVGLLSTEIFGYRDAASLEYAKTLGQAFQMTNIIRDLREDAQRNRLYLPLEELARFGVEEAQLLEGEDGPEVRALLAYEVQLTEALYQQAYDLLPEVDRPRQRASLIMAAIYEAILKRIGRNPSRVLRHSIGISAPRKLWLAWRTARANANAI